MYDGLGSALQAAGYPNVIVDDEYRECICFLCVDERDENGVMQKQPRATAFLAAMPITESAGAFYLVTARHVIDESRQYGQLFARLNLRTGGTVHHPVPQDAWIQHPSTDVAVLSFDCPDGVRVRHLTPVNFADDQYLNWYSPMPGDELFFLGLFAAYSGSNQQAEPIVRFGHVALGLKKIPLTLSSVSQPVHVDAYLAETKSWGGESGSPVFHKNIAGAGSSLRIRISMANPRLIGLLHGHYEIPAPTSGGEMVDLNSGIGVVIPTKAIMETLMSPELVEQRERWKKELESKVPPKPD